MAKQNIPSSFLLAYQAPSSDSHLCPPAIYHQKCKKMGLKLSHMKKLAEERKNLRIWSQRIKKVFYEEMFQSTATQTERDIWIRTTLFKMKKALEEIKKRMDQIDNEQMSIVLEIRMLRKFITKHYRVNILRA